MLSYPPLKQVNFDTFFKIYPYDPPTFIKNNHLRIEAIKILTLKLRLHLLDRKTFNGAEMLMDTQC